ncbi:MAG: hypothetical protein JRG91_10200 [Deltaproteobacteria bacterium]|nr:hypothetical protein [Deltaproteobacteria bacterium]
MRLSCTITLIAAAWLAQACSCSSSSLKGEPHLEGFGDCEPGAPVDTSHWILQAGGPDDEMALSAAEMVDGTIVVAGLTGSFSGDIDLWILRLDGEGSVLGQWTALEVTEDLAPVVAALDDCGMVVAGVTEVDTSGGTDIWLARFDASGTVLWERNLGGPGDEHSPEVIQTADGDLLVTAVTESFSSSADMWLVKLDLEGGILWQEALGGDGDEQTAGRETLLEAPDGSIYILAQSSSFSSMEWDAWVIALDPDGAVRWQQAVGVSGTGSTTGSAIAMSGGDLYFAGQTDQSPHPTCAAWLVRMTTAGDVVWQRAYSAGGCDAATGVAPRAGGGVLVAGFTAPESPSSEYDMWFASIDPDGTIAAQTKIGGTGELELGMSLFIHRDAPLLLGRHISGGGTGDHDLLLARLQPDGTLPGTCGLVTDVASTGEDSTAEVLETDVTPLETDGETRSVALTFGIADQPVELLCPE